MDKQVQAWPPSLWAATGSAAVDAPPLMQSTRCDVAIVGAGYTGLSTALHLAESGVSVCVVDAAEPGWGASGRNGGQVIPGLKYDPDQLRVMFGTTVADPLIAAIGSAADTVFDLIRRHGIECDALRNGWIQPTHSDKTMRALEKRARQWQAEGAHAQLMDGAEVARHIGTQAYVGGWKDHRAGSIHPLKYCRGLARAAQGLGVAIQRNLPY